MTSLRHPLLHGARRSGVVLVIVLITIAALTLAAYSFSERMLAQSEATLLAGRQVQARMLAASGIARAQAFLSLDPASQNQSGGYYDNAAYFQAVKVVDEGDDESRGLFSVVSPALDSSGNATGPRFGLENESARLNLNALLIIDQIAAKSGQTDAGRKLLMALPGMSEDIADALLDWMDTDSEPRAYGAEADYYAGLSPPYGPRNGPLQTIEELLLIRGVTPELLFGADTNRNGLVDANEAGATTGTDTSANSGRGWACMLTVYSKEKNVAATGEPRIDLNGDDLQTLSESLSAVFPPAWGTFILAYRQSGPYTGNDAGRDVTSASLDLTQAPKVKLSQVLDLIGKKVQVRLPNERDPVVWKSPFSSDQAAMATYLPTLVDRVTIVPAQVIPARININQAPRELLLGIPGMTEELVGQIVERRVAVPERDDPTQQNETWLLTQGLVTLDQMRSLLPFVCSGGAVYRAQAVGYFAAGGAAARVEAVFDATQQPARLLLWRDVSHLGRGFPLETLGVQSTGTR